MKGKLNDFFSKKEIIFCGFLFVAFAVTAYLFPYSGDDWAWGSEIGVDRLESGFEGYNGRYLGNLLVMTLTRSRLLQVITVAFSMLCVCVFPKLYCRSRKLSLLAFSAFLVFLMPKQIFVQSVAWTAGFSNYMPPILLIVLYFIFVKNIFSENPIYKKHISAITFLLGFSCTLFMENVTLYAVMISALIAVFARVRHGRFYFAHLANFIGCLVGTVLMFSNSVYLTILDNGDGYRSTAISKGLLSTLKGHLEVIINQVFISNIPLLAVISVMCVVLAVLFAKKSKNVYLRIISFGSVFINVFTLAVLLAKKSFSYWIIAAGADASSKITFVFLMLTVCLYCISVLVSVLICITDNDLKFRTLLILISAPIVTAPLLFVNPIGPRCFMPVYILLVLFAVCVFDMIQKEIDFSESLNKVITVSSSAVCLAMFIFTFSIYSTVHAYAEKRDEYVKKQAESGNKVITVCRIPYSSYVWTGDPDCSPWDYRYKLFYGIDENTEFVFLSYTEFDEWAKEYDK